MFGSASVCCEVSWFGDFVDSSCPRLGKSCCFLQFCRRLSLVLLGGLPRNLISVCYVTSEAKTSTFFCLFPDGTHEILVHPAAIVELQLQLEHQQKPRLNQTLSPGQWSDWHRSSENEEKFNKKCYSFVVVFIPILAPSLEESEAIRDLRWR